MVILPMCSWGATFPIYCLICIKFPLMRAIAAEKCWLFLLVRRGWINFIPLVWSESWILEQIQNTYTIVCYSFDFLRFQKDNSCLLHRIFICLTGFKVGACLKYSILCKSALMNGHTSRPGEKPAVIEKGKYKLG